MRASDNGITGDLLNPTMHARFAGWLAIVGWAGMLVFTFHACTHMVAAGDTWVAMACGRHFVNHGVDTVEPFSANSHKAGPTPEEVQTWPTWAQWVTDKVGLETVRRWHPTGWINQNWLTHVIFYRLTTALGSEAAPYYDALVLWKFGIYLLAAAALYVTARIYRIHPALAAVFISFAMFIGRSFFDVRPAGFSNLLVAVLILVLALASHRNALYIWLIVPLIIFWSNVHGGYVYSFIVLVPFVIWHGIMNLPRRWSIAAYSILTWLTLYGLANRVLHHEYLTPKAPLTDIMLYLVLAACAVSVALAWKRQVGDDAFIVYHTVASCVLFVLLLPRFFPVIPPTVAGRAKSELEVYITGSRLGYLGIFSFAMICGATVVFLKDKVVRVMSLRGVLHTAAAAVVAFVAMVVFNPFHLTNLTHTFVISVSRNAERWRDVHEWHRAFDWSNPVGTAVPFLVMYVLGWLALLAWIFVLVRTVRTMNLPGKKRPKAVAICEWPKIDIALLAIAALTIYMAIRSRRFIPIAAFVACPVIALLIAQAVRMVAVTMPSYRTGKLAMPPMPATLWPILTAAGGVIVLGFALVWGLRFKRVYLDYWPADPKFTSVFMRMTASDAKPFHVCEFIRRNGLRGNMYNYWTEGGFIAWGQDPDPNTGQIPLKLFMDGRAQAAYDVKAFDRWTDILRGGPTMIRSMATGSKLTGSDYREIGDWIGEELKKHDVWVVLMPFNQFNTPFTYGLEYSANWRTVYIDDRQKLFVDATSPPGANLYQAMLTGRLNYPDEYSANLSLGHNLLLFLDSARKSNGLELVIKAFNANPSAAPMLEMLLLATQSAELRPRVDQVCEQYVRSFEKDKEKYAGKDGYNLRLEAVRLALVRLEQAARANGATQEADAYRQQIRLYEAERDRIAATKRW